MPSSGRISIHRPFTAPINHLDVLVSLHFYWLFSYSSTSTTRTQGGNPDLREAIRTSGRPSGPQGGYPVLREAIRTSGREGVLREGIRN